MYTLYVLVRNLASRGQPLRGAQLRLRDFRLQEIRQGDQAAVRELRRLLRTDDVNYGDWLLEREYQDAPPTAGQDPAGVGRIPIDAEDTLFLLRLFRPGDLTFARLAIRLPNDSCVIQTSYRMIGDSLNNSIFPYVIQQDECASCDRFADDLVRTPAWGSTWFAVARRFFLYGGVKEFSPTWDEVDRLVDYTVALEAALVPERDFLGARLRNRAARLISADENGANAVVRQIRSLYEFRSKSVHGAPLSGQSRIVLSNECPGFESLVRVVLVEA